MRIPTTVSGLSLLAALAVIPFAFAQPASAQMVGVNVSATVTGATFWVDGSPHVTSGQFLWQVGSKHYIEVRYPIQLIGDNRSRVAFQQFQDNKTLLQATNSPIQIISVDPTVTSYVITFQLQHRVDLFINQEPQYNFFDPSSINLVSGFTCAFGSPYVSSYGFVTAQGLSAPCGGSSITTSTWNWFAAGSVLILNAYPYPGKVFAGWYMSNGGTMAYLGSLTVNGPMLVTANFVDGRRYYIDSSPVSGLRVLVDRTSVPARTPGKCYNANYPDPNNPPPPATTPGSSNTPTLPPYGPGQIVPLCDGNLDLAPGSQHLFAAPPSQMDGSGRMWAFDHWDFGDTTTGGQNSLVTVQNGVWSPATYTAVFVKGVRASFVTNPTNLKLRIDGRDNWPSYNFEWGVGQVHTVSAPEITTDSKGRKYRFVSWSNGGTAEQQVTIPEGGPDNPGSFRMVAQYELLGQLTLKSEPSASLTVNVDGVDCALPCTLDRPAGTVVALQAVPEQAISPDAKIAFGGWSDGDSSAAKTVTFTSDATVLVARYSNLNRLRLSSTPENGVNWVTDPAPGPGGYFTAGTRVQVTAQTKPGFKFIRFEGSLTGSWNSGTVTLNVPRSVLARLQEIPALPEGAVRNAAGETPDAVVAPGSLISIKGVHLSPDIEKGPDSPLAQTLQGVIVLQNGRMLPLVSVSPDEIIAQLPSDVPEGDTSLTVRPPDQPSVSTNFSVARNAPGLFSLPDGDPDVPIALAFHEDGTPITPDSPAKAGELVSLLGTGFGASDPAALDGFAAPKDTPMPLNSKDVVQLTVGIDPRPFDWCGTAPERVGYSLIRFLMDPTMGQAQNIEVKVTINGRDSNVVLLPLE
jgi:uncharacterized protein (TIGR03437 family)